MTPQFKLLSSLPQLPHLSWSTSLLLLLAALLSVPLLVFTSILRRELTAPHRNLPGPSPHHWFYGSLLALMNLPAGTLSSQWLQTYGPTLSYLSIFRRPEIMTADSVAINHMYSHPDLFDRLESSRKGNFALTGKSLIWAVGEDHKRLRKIMVPSFGPAQIKQLSSAFLDKSHQLKDRLLALCTEEGKGAEVDVVKWMDKVTVDIIGLAGFDYDFGSMQQEENELLGAWKRMQEGFADRSWLAMLQFTGVPLAGRLWKSKRQEGVAVAKAVTMTVAQRIVNEKKRTIDLENSGQVKKSDFETRDILTTLLRANMASDLKPEQRMSDEELVAQIPLFLLAGNITTSSVLTWAFINLSQTPSMQDRLRAEVMSVPDDHPAFETINSLPYLEAFTHEVLRVYPSAPVALRQVMANTVIPLGTPVKGRDGRMMDHIPVRKGTTILIPILNINTSSSYFGRDVSQFNPDRFLDPAVGTDHTMPGPYGGLMTFGAGSHACIGFRFAMAEIKTVLFVLLRHLTFNEPADKPVYQSFGGIGVLRAKRVGGRVGGRDMGVPIIVRPASG